MGTNHQKLKNSERIRQAALRAARQVFLQKGYDASLDEIAEVAGIARRSLYYIYGNKEQLFLKLFEDVIDLAPVFELLRPDQDIRPTLMAFAKRYSDHVLDQEALAFHRLLYAEQARFPDAVRQVAEAEFRRLLPPLQTYFKKILEGGILRPVDPAFASEHFLSMVVGHERMRRVLGTSARSRKRRDLYIAYAVDSFLWGHMHLEPAKGEEAYEEAEGAEMSDRESRPMAD